MARPRKEIDQKQFESLCGLQCTEKEICDFLGVTDKTLSSWCKRTYGASFSETYAKKRGTGKISLRRNLWRLSEKNAATAIFLAKNYLGMSDNPEPELPKDDISEDALSKSLREFEEGLTSDGPT